MQGAITKSTGKLRNSALNGVISESGWGTPPSNLSNAIDGDDATWTGEGLTTLESAGVIGNIILDLKTAKKRMICVKTDLWSSAGTISLIADSMPTDNPTNAMSGNTIATQTRTSQNNPLSQRDSLVQYISTRYLKLRFYGSAAGTYHVLVNSIICSEF